VRQRTKPRRVPLALVAITAATVLVGLSACSSSSGSTSTSSSGTPDYGDITIQLSYLKNTEFAGEYEAIEQGYFTKAGFGTVTLTAGGGSASAETQVATGKALIGISGPLITGPAITKGASLKIIGAEYQKNAFDIDSLKSAPITKPSQLKGKTIAVFAPSELYWDAFLKANHISASDVKVVPYTDGASQLASGQVDGYMGFSTSFTGTVGKDKLPAQHFLLADAGLPGVSETLMASTDSISNHRDELVAALTAIAQGWKYAVAHNAAATKLTVEKYGKSQDYAYADQLAAITAQDDLMVSDETKTNGLLTISPSLQKKTVAGMKLAGIDVDQSTLFDTTLIDDVYTQHPNLK
jgi:ABC-type nitrate/sulfonate/bicarbonate transport system substrate-binding protein